MNTVTLPLDMAERLMDLAADKGVGNVETLMMFSEVRLRIEEAKAQSKPDTRASNRNAR